MHSQIYIAHKNCLLINGNFEELKKKKILLPHKSSKLIKKNYGFTRFKVV